MNYSIEVSTNAEGKVQWKAKVSFEEGEDQVALKKLKLLDICIRQDYEGRLAGED